MARQRLRGFENGTVKPLKGKSGNPDRWQGIYHDYVPDGDGGETRHTRRIIVGLRKEMTKGEAEEKLREIIRRKFEKPAAETPQAKMRTHVEDYYRLKLGDWEEHTRRTMRSMFDRVILPALGDRAVNSITAEDLKKFIADLPYRIWTTSSRKELNAEGQRVEVPGQEKTGISRSYTKWIISTVRALFKYAIYKDLIVKNPADDMFVTLRPPRLARPKEQPFLPEEEWNPFIDALGERDPRDAMLAWISLLCGTRPSELFAVKVERVGPIHPQLCSCGMQIKKSLDRWRKEKGTKTEKPRRIIVPPFLAQELHAWIRDHQLGPDDYVFTNTYGKALNRQNLLNRRLRPAAKRAGIRTLHVDWRMLRRSCATWAYEKGVDLKSIQKQMGHAKPDITLLEYVQSVDPAAVAQLTKFEMILRSKKARALESVEIGPTGVIQ